MNRFDVDAIRAAHPLPEYLTGRGFTLRRTRDRWAMLCPFHDERTPSFAVWPDHGHCFGCGWHGDTIDLVAALDGLDFAETCRRLGGIETASDYRPDPAAEARRRQRIEREARAARLAEGAAGIRDRIERNFRWTADEIVEADRYRGYFEADPIRRQDWRLFVSCLFGREDVVWIGELRDSGRAEHADRFRTCGAWMRCDTRPASRTCAATFKPGSFARSAEAVARVPYVVIEADEPPTLGRKPETPAEIETCKAWNRAVIRWLVEAAGLTLRAVVDTGHKSLHGWFDHPGEETLADLASVAEPLGIDSLVARPAQPLRLPGANHEKTGRPAELVFFNPPQKP